MQEEWAFNNRMKLKTTKTTSRGEKQAEDCYTVKHRDNGSAQDYRHQEAK